jgi:hypothetical protein
MNAPRLTDDRISQALRAHLPDHARTGLRERVLETTEATSQQHALPWLLGGLGDGDPMTRRRSVLLAAALLVAVALATAAAVGAWRLLHRDPLPPQLTLEPPADVPAYVSSTVDRLPQLPPVAFTLLASDGGSDRIYVDRSGAVRFERYASADAPDPTTSLLLSGNRVGRTVIVGSNPVWIEQDGAIGEDPRGYLRAVTDLWSGGGSGCDLQPDPSADPAATQVPGWRYVGAELVAGRPAQHLACGGEDVWIDDATRLILRNRTQDVDDAGNPIAGAFHTSEVTKIEFGDQPASLFAFAPPPGVAAMSDATYGALCPGDTVALLDYPPCAGTAAAATPTPEPTPIPTPTPPPDPSDCAIASAKSGEGTGPLTWTKASEQQDWPAPVRSEPAGGASVASMPPTYIDPSGDTGSSATSCIDIRDLTAGLKSLSFDVMSKPPTVDPSQAWIAYGVVIDEDRDGIPDWRYGIDNLPGTSAMKEDHHRAWRTNLHTGRTDFNPSAWPGVDMDKVGDTYFGSRYPAFDSSAGFRFYYTADVTNGGEVKVGAKQDKPFYVWASLIVDGRVVATDYAPDTGWLLPSAGTSAGGTYVLPSKLLGNGRGGAAHGPLRISMTLPAGWSGPMGLIGAGSTAEDSNVGLEFKVVDKTDMPTCDRSGSYVQAQVGPGVDDLVSYLEGLTQPLSSKTKFTVKISQKTAVTVDGYRGTYVEYKWDVSEDNCEGGTWPTGHAFGDYRQVWILDVDGVRLVIDGGTPKGSETDKAVLQQIVDSIHIGP